MNDSGDTNYVQEVKMRNDTRKALKEAEEQLEKLARSIHYMEEIIILSAISDKHALELQKWIKEYKLDIEQTDAHITEVRTHG
jgi:predicted transcriptional regulator